MLWNNDDINSALELNVEDNWQASGVSIDSRTLCKGDLFVAVKGPLHDGHDFVEEAFAKGACAAIVSSDFKSKSKYLVRVPDVQQAIEKLAKYARKRSKAKVIAVTGSVGKTSCKEALIISLSTQGKVQANAKSLNNHWGVPITLMQLKKDTDYMIVEMGMNNLGEIACYSMMAEPDVALITTITESHIGRLGSLEKIAEAKSEVFMGLKPDGIGIVNCDNLYYPNIMEFARKFGVPHVLTFGTAQGSSVQLVLAEISPQGSTFEYMIDGAAVTVTLPVYGKHWGLNVAGVFACVIAVGADVYQAAASLLDFALLPGRGVQHALPENVIVIDESYNASPASMKAAIEVLGCASGANRKIAVLGDMLELGELDIKSHTDLYEVLKASCIDKVFTSGPLMRHLYESLPDSMRGSHNDDPKLLALDVCHTLLPGDVIMVKGSRGAYKEHGRMYAVVDAVLNKYNTKRAKY